MASRTHSTNGPAPFPTPSALFFLPASGPRPPPSSSLRPPAYAFCSLAVSLVSMVKMAS